MVRQIGNGHAARGGRVAADGRLAVVGSVVAAVRDGDGENDGARDSRRDAVAPGQHIGVRVTVVAAVRREVGAGDAVHGVAGGPGERRGQVVGDLKAADGSAAQVLDHDGELDRMRTVSVVRQGRHPFRRADDRGGVAEVGAVVVRTGRRRHVLGVTAAGERGACQHTPDVGHVDTESAGRQAGEVVIPARVRGNGAVVDVVRGAERVVRSRPGQVHGDAGNARLTHVLVRARVLVAPDEIPDRHVALHPEVGAVVVAGRSEIVESDRVGGGDRHTGGKRGVVEVDLVGARGQPHEVIGARTVRGRAVGDVVRRTQCAVAPSPGQIDLDPGQARLFDHLHAVPVLVVVHEVTD